MSNQSQQFWVVWREHGGSPTYKHFEKRHAQDEARRLAKQCPGSQFFILKATDGVRAEDPKTTRIRLVPSNDVPF